MPGPGGYWLCPARIAAMAASAISIGPSVSGKPWPRLTDPVATASADISAKMVVPRPCSRSASGSRVMAPPWHRGLPARSRGSHPVDETEQVAGDADRVGARCEVATLALED